MLQTEFAAVVEPQARFPLEEDGASIVEVGGGCQRAGDPACDLVVGVLARLGSIAQQSIPRAALRDRDLMSLLRALCRFLLAHVPPRVATGERPIR